jgi:hypothetical protein
MPRVPPVLRIAFVAGLLSALSCSSDRISVLEEACRVVVRDCGIGDSVGACIDALGSQLDQCLICIAESGCDYGTRCDADTARCELPVAYQP